jgi:hypothetical protein|tara:strand:- start:356 stop:691 length:336 start_codon:yes stop_codon:yes gene_type:complete
MSDIASSILKINPKAEFSVRADNIDEIVWLNGTTPISKADIEAQFTAVELDYAMETLRINRNKLLAETDYLALSDNTLSDDMKTYRQKLRDITAGLDTVAKVNKVTMPTKP